MAPHDRTAQRGDHATPVRRTAGYLNVRDYAVIGDGRTAALVGRDGSIDWLALPNLDSPTVFAAMLDAKHGGAFVLQPDAPFRVSRRYVPGTNVLETTFVTEDGTVQVTDALTLFDGATLCPQRELQRRIRAVRGRVPMSWKIDPRFGYGQARVRLSWRLGRPVATCGSIAAAVCSFGAGQPSLVDNAVIGQFTATPKAEAVLALSFTEQEPLLFPSRADCDARMSSTAAAWQGWSARASTPTRWREAVLRSALTVKLLVYAPSGAIAAAATSSLPEQIGGERNWDYRYSWVRDSAFTLNAFLQLGYTDEARGYYWWLMHASRLTFPRLRVLYQLDGGVSRGERTLPLAGYRGSRPVRAGNAAADQLQLDTYGELLQTSSVYAHAAGGLDGDLAHRLARIADYVCRTWQRPDAGIWEVRSQPQHFTQSKMMCWVALERAAAIAEHGRVSARRHARWRSNQDQIRQFITERCVSPQHGYYVRRTGGDELDAAVLLGLLHGYSDETDPVMCATVDAINTQLRNGPFVDRYHGEDGLRGSEGAFLACSFWLAEALAHVGRIDEAASLMDELIELANDVGLYSEEVDPDSGAFLGNLPQALSHLALINAAFTIAARTDTE